MYEHEPINVGNNHNNDKIDEDQINDMANRRSISKEQLKKWLASSLR